MPMIDVMAHARRALQTVAVTAVLGLLVLLVWHLTHQPARPRYGQAAPTFSLPVLNGTGELALASLRGRAVLANFWSSTCVPCVKEAAALESLYQHHQKAGLVVLGIDPEDFKSDARRFIARHGITYPNVNDVGEHVADRYGITGTPETFVIDRQGRVIQTLIGPIDESANRRILAEALHQALS
jgi:cytochrome c biogenesis protein CcmG, thiol:disulfide interchange protein DsbE